MRDPLNLLWPIGHVAGSSQESGVGRFLADGVARHERVPLLADELVARRWPRELREEGALVLAATDDLYQPLRDGDLKGAADALW